MILKRKTLAATTIEGATVKTQKMLLQGSGFIWVGIVRYEEGDKDGTILFMAPYSQQECHDLADKLQELVTALRGGTLKL